MCSPTGAVIVTGQLTFQLFPLITLAWIAARHNAWVRAGLLLGIVAAIKPHLGLFGLFLLAAGQWRAVVAMASTVCASLRLAASRGWDTRNGLERRAVDWVGRRWWIVAGLFARVFDGSSNRCCRLRAGVALTVAAGIAIVAYVETVAGIVCRRSMFALVLPAAQLVSPLGILPRMAVGPPRCA